MVNYPNIPNFKIVEEIKPAGGWANVYVAEYEGREVALKVLKKKHTTNFSNIKNFYLEAKTLSKFDHPNIAKVVYFDYSKIPPHYFVLEYYNKGNLENLIKKRGSLPPQMILEIAIQICYALETLHSEGQLHLDIKPSNILFGNDNTVVITDFGSSKSIGSWEDHSGRTGTPQYMSPEQFDEEKELTFASDLYSLGIIMYYMASGQLPFNGEDMHQLSLLHATTKPFSIRTINSKFSKKLDAVILKLLEKSPQKRYKNAHTLSEDLKNLKGKSEGHSYKITIENRSSNKADSKPVSYKKFPIYLENHISRSNNYLLEHKTDESDQFLIQKRSDGDLIYTDNSKRGSIVNGEKIKKESVFLSGKYHNVIIGKNQLRLKKEESHDSTKYLKYLIPAPLLIILIIVLMLGGRVNDEYSLLLNDFDVQQNEIFVGETIDFNYGIEEAKYEITNIIVKPFQGAEEILLNPSEKTFFLQSIPNNNVTEIQFGIRLVDIKGTKSNWMFDQIKIKKSEVELRIVNVRGIPDRVKVDENISFSFECLPSTINKKILVQIEETNQYGTVNSTGLQDFSSIQNNNVNWQFAETGNSVIKIIAVTEDGTSRSNTYVKNVTVQPQISDPEIEITNYRVQNGKLRFYLKTKDPIISSFDSLSYKLYINDTLSYYKPKNEYNEYPISQPDIYDVVVEVETPDKRVGKSNAITVSTRPEPTINFTSNPRIQNNQLVFAYTFKDELENEYNLSDLRIEFYIDNNFVRLLEPQKGSVAKIDTMIHGNVDTKLVLITPDKRKAESEIMKVSGSQ